MGVVFRQSVKTSLVVLGGALLGAVWTFVSARYLHKQDFGFIKTLTNNAVIVSQLLTLGMSNTLVVFIHRFSKDDERRKVLLSLCILVPLAAFFIFLAVYLGCRPWVLNHFQPADRPLMNRYFLWLPPYSLLIMYLALLEQYLGSQMKVAISVFMREVVLRLFNMAIVLLFAFGYIDFTTLVISTVLVYLVPLFILILLSRRTRGFGLSFRFSSFNHAEYREMAHFGWFHFLLGISISLISVMDQNLLPLYDHSGFDSVAVYSIAVLIISFLQMPLKAFMPASLAVLTQAFNDNDLPRAADIFRRSSINVLIPSMAIGILLACNLHNAVAVIGNNGNYADMAPVVLILMLGQLFNIATGINDQVLSVTNYYKFTSYSSIAIVGMLYVMLRLSISHYGMVGAAWSTTVALVIYNLVKLLFIHRQLGLMPFSAATLRILLAAVPACIVGWFLPHFFDTGRHIYVHAVADTALRSAAIMIIYLLMLLWLKPSEDLESWLAGVRKNKRLF